MFENEITLDISLVNEYGRDWDPKVKTKDSEVRKFLKDSSISIDQLQGRLAKITKESKNSQIIWEVMGTESKDDALRICYETIKYIEVLWNQMIAYETSLLYKYNSQIESNQ